MVSENLIVRRPSPKDRRSYEIGITEAGRTLLGEMDQTLSDWIGGMLGEIPVEELNNMTGHFVDIRHTFVEDE